MKQNNKIKLKYLICILCIAFFSLAGYLYISASPAGDQKEDTWTDSGFLKVGHHLTIQNADSRLSLLDNKDVLSASGLYYAAWTMGASEPYENSDGDTVDLYDAQLYLCLSEHKNAEDADKNMTKWLDAAKNNYQVLTEEEIICNGPVLLLLTYDCASEGNPYDRGVSAFGTFENDALCMELTCGQYFDADLREILLSFLDNCSYSTD